VRVGFGQADITPQTEVTLSGFIFRMEEPAQGVDDPLFVRALALMNDDTDPVLLLSYDLLGIGSELHRRIIDQALEAISPQVSGERLCLVCTHTHGAPATVHLEGCGTPSPEYWGLVCRASAEAARRALASVSGPTRFEWEVKRVPGVSYCRRKVLADGRVVMAQHPDAEVLREAQTDETLFLGRFVTHHGSTIAGIAHFAAHACTVCGSQVTADYPGVLCTELSHHYGAPFLFLQGASGNVNPVFNEMTREAMLANVGSMMARVREPDRLCSGVEPGPVSWAEDHLALAYAPVPPAEELRSQVKALELIADGVLTSGGGEGAGRLSNILNVRPGHGVDLPRARFAAQTMAQALRRTLSALEGDRLSRTCPLSIKVLAVGGTYFPIIAAEVFAETGRALADSLRESVVRTVGCGSPLCGYLPTTEAIGEGGYEAEDAHLFYGHPSSFAKGTEKMVVATASRLLAQCHARRERG
jgi:hypothetical protein